MVPRGYPGSGPIGKKRLAKLKATKPKKLRPGQPPPDELPAVTPATAAAYAAKIHELSVENSQLKREVATLTTRVTELRLELGELAIDALRVIKTDRL